MTLFWSHHEQTQNRSPGRRRGIPRHDGHPAGGRRQRDRVLLVPRQQNTYAQVGVVAEVSRRVRLPGHGAAVSLTALHRAVPGVAAADADGVLRVEVDERPDQVPPASLTRELEREYRAVVDEILELRGDDGRISAFVRSITDPGALADTVRLFAGSRASPQKIQLLETLDVVERLSAGAAAPAGAARPSWWSASGSAKTSKAARRSSSASTSCASRWTRSARSSAKTTVPPRSTTARRLPPRACPTPSGSRPSASCRGSSGWATRTPSRPRSARISTGCWRCPGRSVPRSASIRSTRGEVLDADHEGLDEVKKRITEYLAVRKLRAERGMTETRRSGVILTLDRPAGNRQDLDRRVDRQGDRPAVRPHVARRRPRRGGDPRPSPHLHRRAARTAGARAARRRHDESGDHARRGRQARRRLARRSVGGAARGARPGAEPRVPRSLPRRRARSVARAVHRDRQRGRHDSRSAARSDGGDPLRRLHHRREGGDCARSSVAAPDRAERAASRRSRR